MSSKRLPEGSQNSQIPYGRFAVDASTACVRTQAQKHKFTLYLSDDEYRILSAKAKISGMRSMSSFLRQLIIESIIYDVDYKYLREYNSLLGHISGNINQIAKRANETRSIYQRDVDELKKEIEKIWQLQRSILSRQPSLGQ